MAKRKTIFGGGVGGKRYVRNMKVLEEMLFSYKRLTVAIPDIVNIKRMGYETLARKQKGFENPLYILFV
ncbi:hypothetical protein OUZ56_028991 [Daphnia magna]|uniref:Uncharacterized protein n=1 Tax=Daphnia magna TaxID=35525 RepID=A0ABR0B5I8_9CRUS|nr:hypothetical protein OUZ56_028991 [Daphnia magna]